MSQIKHTPGPWFITKKYVVGPKDDSDSQGFGMIIGLADVYGDNRNQDARLIAAAPDLLAVVREACAIFDANHEGGEMDEYNGDLANDLWKDEIHRKLTDAIAKAEGRALPLNAEGGDK